MKSAGHLVIGVLVTTTADALFPFIPAGDTAGTLLVLGATGVGALLPDIDSDNSAIRSQMGLSARKSGLGWLLSLGLRKAGVQHRTVTHSLLALAVAATIGLALEVFAVRGIGMAFALGYASHLVADMLTVSGVPLLWPMDRDFHMLPKLLRFRTGSTVETAVTVAAAAICLTLAGSSLLARWL